MLRQKTHNRIVGEFQNQINDLRAQLQNTWGEIGHLFGDQLPAKLAELRQTRTVKVTNAQNARKLASELLAYAKAEEEGIKILNGVISTGETIVANRVEVEEVEVPASVAAALASIADA